MIKKGVFVKLLMVVNQFNITEEGFVVSWDQDFIHLKDEHGNETIITNPEDVKVVKIIYKNNKQINQELEENFEEVYEEHHDPSDEMRNKKLSELKILLNKQEKKIISEKLKDHMPNSMPTNQKYESRYGTPGLFKK